MVVADEDRRVDRGRGAHRCLRRVPGSQAQLVGYHEEIWIAAAMVGMAAVICGSILAVTSLRKPRNTSDRWRSPSRTSRKMPTTSSARAADSARNTAYIHIKESETVDPLIIPIVGILMPLVLVPTILVLKHRHKRREWEHRERMRAMERPDAPHAVGGLAWAPGGVAAIGAGVPMASVLAAFSDRPHLGADDTLDDVPVPAVAWGCAVLISAGGLITSLILALLQARTQRRLDSAAAADSTPRSRLSTRTRSTWWGAEAEPTRRAGPVVPSRSSPRRAQIAISGSSGMWNRAETIVRAWNIAIAAAVAIVGNSRLRVAGPASSKPSEGEQGQPEVRHPIDQQPRLGIRLVEEDEVPQPPQAEPRVSPRVGRQLGQRPTEQDPRPLGLGDRAEPALVGLASGRCRR